MGYTEEKFSVKGKTCLITGASRGIGKSLADSFHQAGAIVYGLGRTTNINDSVAWRYYETDITNKGYIKEIVDSIHEKEGKLDVLINAAGITNSFSDSDDISSFHQILDTNLTSVHNLCVIVSEYMKSAQRGSIINLTSIGANLGFAGNLGYASSKGGLKMLTKALANDLAQYNIRVNNLAPGYIKTDMTKGSFDNEVLNKERVDRMMIKRWGETEDLIGPALFLASDASSYITGIDLLVDGGWTAKGL